MMSDWSGQICYNLMGSSFREFVVIHLPMIFLGSLWVKISLLLPLVTSVAPFILRCCQYFQNVELVPAYVLPRKRVTFLLLWPLDYNQIPTLQSIMCFCTSIFLLYSECLQTKQYVPNHGKLNGNWTRSNEQGCIDMVVCSLQASHQRPVVAIKIFMESI
jgi:hypothetical protein